MLIELHIENRQHGAINPTPCCLFFDFNLKKINQR